MNDSKDKIVNIIKATRILQAKVGSGEIQDERIRKSQALIDQNRTDFVPMAEEYLTRLEKALHATPVDEIHDRAHVKKIIAPIVVEVMQLKANAGMFHYTLIGELAGIALNFLENLPRWDQDAFEIVEAHRRSLWTILHGQIQGSGGAYGQQLQSELREACQRYYLKSAH